MSASACAWVDDASVNAYIDADGDGLPAQNFGGEDCDDNDASVGGPTDGHTDADGDGFGDVVETSHGCAVTTDATDCDDSQAEIHPGALETCDAAGVDENCDGEAAGCTIEDAGFVVTGAEVDGELGASVAVFPDVDEDGRDEILLGAPGAPGVPDEEFATDPEAGAGHCGEWYMVSPSAPKADGTWAEPRVSVATRAQLVTYGAEETGRTGAALLVAEMTGDDVPDVVFTAPLANIDAGMENGAAYILSGHNQWSGELYANQVWITFDNEDYGRYTSSVAVSTDAGIDPDAIFGAPGRYAGSGGAVVYHLPFVESWGAGDYTYPIARIDRDLDLHEAVGTSVATADLTGDGVLDYIMGAPLADRAGDDAGAVYVLVGPVEYGELGEYNLSQGFRLDGAGGGDGAGAALYTADFDDDGSRDLAVAALGANAGAGAVYLVGNGIDWTDGGGSAGIAGAFATIDGLERGGGIGAVMLMVGERFAIGASARNDAAGGVYFLTGALSGAVDISTAATLAAGPRGSHAGASLAVGELDGDGEPDLLVGAPTAGQDVDGDGIGDTVGEVAMMPGVSLP